MEVARDVSERYKQTEGWIEAMAEQGVEGLLLIGLWEKTKATQTLESPQSDPKITQLPRAGHRDVSSRRETLEEIRTFQNGFDDPRPSSCQEQPGSTKLRNPRNNRGSARLRRPWCEPGSGGAGLCRVFTLPHMGNMPDTVPSPHHTSAHSSSQWPPRQRTRSHRANEDRLVWAVQQGTRDES